MTTIRGTIVQNEEGGMAFRPFPVDNQRTRSELRKRLLQHQASTSDTILNGGLPTLEEYRNRIGVLRGLSIALQELDDIEKQEN